jgi:hypothetical protein
MVSSARCRNVGWCVLVSLSTGSWIVACSEGFSGSACKETHTCAPSRGGQGGDLGDEGGAPAPSLGGANGEAGGEGGVGDSAARNDGGTSMGIAGDASTVSSCPEDYEVWLASGFSFPDGDVIGTGDFPSQPWIKAGALRIEAGRLTGLGSASLGQGAAFSYDGLRLRFRARFSDSGQTASVAFNGARNDVIGLYVTVDSSGRVTLSEGNVVAEEAEIAPLESGVDWFVEATLTGKSAIVTLARDNYGSETQSNIDASLVAEGLKANAIGEKTLV